MGHFPVSISLSPRPGPQNQIGDGGLTETRGAGAIKAVADASRPANTMHFIFLWKKPVFRVVLEVKSPIC